MLDFLRELVTMLWEHIKFWVVIDHFNAGVRLRLGKPKGVLYSGLHWKIPFMDEILIHMIKTRTLDLSRQSITTKDGEAVTIEATIKFDVSDVETLLLEVNSAEDALGDMTKGIIRKVLMGMEWQECNDGEADKRITSRAKTEGVKWGINVSSVTITSMVKGRVLRIFGDNPLSV